MNNLTTTNDLVFIGKVDPQNGIPFYVNHTTQTAQWEPPAFIQQPVGNPAHLPIGSHHHCAITAPSVSSVTDGDIEITPLSRTPLSSTPP